MGNDNHVVVSHKLCGFQGSVGGRVDMMKEQCVACSTFLLRSPVNLHNDPNDVCELMDCSTMVFANEFSKFFNIFCRFAGAWSLSTFVIFN
jgi:hypothetical protein